MTYIYRFTIKSTGQCYVGQHRNIKCKNKDPMKDWYKGRSPHWEQLLKDLDLYDIQSFRKGVKKEILNIWYGDVDVKEVCKAETIAITETKKKYGKLCVNHAITGVSHWIHPTEKEAIEIYKVTGRPRKERRQHKNESQF